MPRKKQETKVEETETAFDKVEDVVENAEPLTVEEVVTEVEPEVVEEKKTESQLSSTPISVEVALEESAIEKLPLKEKETFITVGELTNEEKIVKYVENSMGKMVKMNDFLKSLYPAPVYNEPPLWKQQMVSKQIKLMLMKMQNDGLIKITNNLHSQLGVCYFDNEGRAKHYDLDVISIFAEK